MSIAVTMQHADWNLPIPKFSTVIGTDLSAHFPLPAVHEPSGSAHHEPLNLKQLEAYAHDSSVIQAVQKALLATDTTRLYVVLHHNLRGKTLLLAYLRLVMT